MAEYHMPMDKALWGIPGGVTAALALLPAYQHRKGGDAAGPTDVDAAAAKAKKKARKWLNDHFEIV
jgi:hypothetical protein